MTIRPAALTAVALLALAVPTATAATSAVPASATLITAAPAVSVVAPTAATVTGGACNDSEGVTVVVDLTDLGGDVEVGCADGDPATGREALESAGFVPTDSSPGFICAIEGLPDPCPEEFDGSYWSYWTAEAAGDWVAHTEGADTTDPAPGSYEGWRYNDGSTGPGVTPTALTGVAASDAGTAASDAATEDASASAPDSAEPAPTSGEVATNEAAGDGPAPDGGFPIGTALGAGALVALLATVAVLLVRRRS